LAQRAHASLRRVRPQALLGARAVDQRLGFLIDHEELVDPGAPYVAGVVARLAAARRVKLLAAEALAELGEVGRAGLVRLLARRTELAHQPLRQHAEQARGKEIGLDGHVDEAGRRA